jgi:hypothetical protein
MKTVFEEIVVVIFVIAVYVALRRNHCWLDSLVETPVVKPTDLFADA